MASLLAVAWLALPTVANSAPAAQTKSNQNNEKLELTAERARAFERNMMAWRLAIATSGLCLVGVPIFVRSRRRRDPSKAQPDSALETVRISALLFLAFAAYASYYDFFEPKFGVGFQDTDVYHYYMGSKYSSEVGYFDLYHCTVMALVDASIESRFDLPPVRDMRTLRMHTPDTTLASARECKQGMARDRWSEFASDVAWFDAKYKGPQWRNVLKDHGYNPSPVWNAIGGFFSSRIPLDSAGFAWLINADRALMIMCFILIVWAFGLEVGALSAIVWGTGQHWAYLWIGDSLLRNLWLFAAIAGLCTLKRNQYLLAGAFLSLSSLLRVFPAIFLVGVSLQMFFQRRRAGKWGGDFKALLIGVVAASCTLLLWGALASDWGAVAYLEFSDKISVFTDQKSVNKLGVSSLIWRSIMMGTGNMTTGAEGQLTVLSYAPQWLPLAIRGGQVVVVIPALWLYWRAVSRARPWEAAALSFALIPLLSDPANYYFSFVIAGALLTFGRPRLQVYLLWAAVLWIANGLYFYRDHDQYLGAGIIAVLYPLAVLYEMSRDTNRDDDIRPLEHGA